MTGIFVKYLANLLVQIGHFFRFIDGFRLFSNRLGFFLHRLHQ